MWCVVCGVCVCVCVCVCVKERGGAFLTNRSSLEGGCADSLSRLSRLPTRLGQRISARSRPHRRVLTRKLEENDLRGCTSCTQNFTSDPHSGDSGGLKMYPRCVRDFGPQNGPKWAKWAKSAKNWSKIVILGCRRWGSKWLVGVVFWCFGVIRDNLGPLRLSNKSGRSPICSRKWPKIGHFGP